MVKEARDERFREIRNTLHTMHAKLEEQLQTKLDALHGRVEPSKCNVQFLLIVF